MLCNESQRVAVRSKINHISQKTRCIGTYTRKEKYIKVTGHQSDKYEIKIMDIQRVKYSSEEKSGLVYSHTTLNDPDLI